MTSNSSRMTDVATQTENIVEATVPYQPPEPLAESSPATNSHTVEKLPRKERRWRFWAPIGAKIGRKQAKRQGQQTTTGEQSTNGRPTSGSQGFAPRAQSTNTISLQPHHQWRQNGAQRTDRISAAPTYHTTPPLQSHGWAPAPDGPSRPYVGNLGSFDRLDAVYTSTSAYSYRQETPSQSSATHVGDVSPSSNSQLPELMLTPADVQGNPARTVSIPDQEELGHNVTGMAPPSPQIPSVSELGLEDLASAAVVSLHLSPVMPDPASSSSAPRRVNDEWDEETRVVELQALSHPSVLGDGSLPSNKANMLLGGMKHLTLAGDRSSTYPGRERSLRLPVGLLLLPCGLINH
jgi:hypothetical protein